MTKITIELTEEEDKQLKHIVVEEGISSKSRYIEQVIKGHLAAITTLKLVEV